MSWAPERLYASNRHPHCLRREWAAAVAVGKSAGIAVAAAAATVAVAAVVAVGRRRQAPAQAPSRVVYRTEPVCIGRVVVDSYSY